MDNVKSAMRNMKNCKKPLTYGEILSPISEIELKEDAAEYLEAMILYQMRFANVERGEAKRISLQNIGYWSGYYDSDTMQRIQELFDAAHPIFGRAKFTPEEAFEAGKALGGKTDG